MKSCIECIFTGSTAVTVCMDCEDGSNFKHIEDLNPAPPEDVMSKTEENIPDFIWLSESFGVYTGPRANSVCYKRYREPATPEADQLKIACEHIRILHGMVLGTENYDSRMIAARAFLKGAE